MDVLSREGREGQNTDQGGSPRHLSLKMAEATIVSKKFSLEE